MHTGWISKDIYFCLNQLRLRLSGSIHTFPDQVMEELLERYIYLRTHSDRGKDCHLAEKARVMFDRQDMRWVLSALADITDKLDESVPGWRELGSDKNAPPPRVVDEKRETQS